jgi:NAD(P)H-dependent FMN reductase
MNSGAKPKVAIIIGSNRPNRICPTIATWVKEQMTRNDLEIDTIDLAEIKLPFLDEPEKPAADNYTKDHTKAWSELIDSYDGYVIVYPQYNWGYPAVLKNALDFLYKEWAGKPVSLMCYGNHGGFQGLMALKLVIVGLKMQSMSTNPPLNISDDMFDEKLQFKNINEAFASYSTPVKAVAQEFVDLINKQNLE